MSTRPKRIAITETRRCSATAAFSASEFEHHARARCHCPEETRFKRLALRFVKSLSRASAWDAPDGKSLSSATPPLQKARRHYLELPVSLPQHSGRAGKEERSQPPPSAWISVTASTMRRPRRFTAVISAARAAF